MYNLIIILTFSILFFTVKIEGQVIVTFNSAKEIRQFAKLSDTLNVEFKPVTKNKNLKYRFRNLTITYEGFTNVKSINKHSHTDTLISNTPSKNPRIEIPLRNYVKDSLDYDMKVDIDIESVEKITNGKSETLNIPKSQLHRVFTCTNN